MLGIYINKIENRITFELKSGCYLDFLSSETVEFLGRTQNKIRDKRQNWRNCGSFGNC